MYGGEGGGEPVINKSSPAGKANLNSAGLIVFASMGRRVSYLVVTSGGEGGFGGGVGYVAGRVCVLWRCGRLGQCPPTYMRPPRGPL